ncbi:hypothetical protein ACTFBT_28835 [Streptomyces microflavus]|uniref:Uncharacterized protein n=1 Tax=Streptomyces microflavus TaxID=1919 RepID=A0A7J0CYF6_STRMI|nr:MULTISPECIES: hypothetical protein [Streptomyces]MDX2974976.1 hypothetical protein [Streptomyces sp. NRRL_B-2249]GFN07428.1 hypothetical protein Smic_59840 [Streptomyces microflavus]GGX62465.1 hypothetical protein GCM10010298_28910 [Streptomyces microflavus]
MGWTFKLHGGIAAALSTVLLALAALTWAPGTVGWFEPQWTVAVAFVPAFLICVAAIGRMILASGDKHALWQAFRCLPGRVQAGLGALAVAGVVIVAIHAAGSEPGRLQDAEKRDGRYYAFDPRPDTRGTVEISKSEYLALLPESRRIFIVIPGVLLAGASCAVLTAGELRRADRGVAAR